MEPNNLSCHCIKASTLDIDISLYPSFLSSIYAWLERRKWLRILGSCAYRQELIQDKSRLCCCGCGCTKRLLRGVSGAWCHNHCRRALEKTQLQVRRIAERLLREYLGLTIAAALEPLDKIIVAYSAILSQNTRYTNTLRWTAEIFTGAETIEEVVVRATNAQNYIKNYQAKILSKIAHKIPEIILSEKTPEEKRKQLLSLKGIGVKTAHSILLFTGESTSYPPPDTHLAKLVAKTLSKTSRKPSKKDCREANCQKCPKAYNCTAGIVAKLYGKAAGLIQTAAYIHGTLKNRRELETLLLKHYTLEARIHALKDKIKHPIRGR